MSSYLLLKFLHILSAIVVAGTGVGIAFFMLMVSRSKNIEAIAITARHVVLADWLFTLPAVVVQLATGLLLMKTLSYSFSSLWFLTVISLFIFIGLCWVPVLVIQYRLRALAAMALIDGRLPPRFVQLMRAWVGLGIPAFFAIVGMIWLMVAKPIPVF